MLDKGTVICIQVRKMQIYHLGILSLRYANNAGVPLAKIFDRGWRKGLPLN